MSVVIQIIVSLFLFSIISSDSNSFGWTTERKLTWSDFKGKPDKSNPAAALTYTDIKMNASLNNDVISILVENLFNQNLSWSKNKNSASLLAHEQLHFDITEIYTRKIRLKMNEIASAKTIQNGTLNKESSKLLKEWKQFQNKYDEETNHGILTDKQKEWQLKVQSLLKEIKD
ncbi:DUF922 domain-containing protein [uncultured Cytophaga sp.]|uniref:DUF922 domain-containing protein n=1 Tax=uncultured Cytophaga sp. TaxID=160238 RepID=UPI00260625E7|nr:DUF922 domain-containing protein [uncultured Cytophaga sp.]